MIFEFFKYLRKKLTKKEMALKIIGTKGVSEIVLSSEQIKSNARHELQCIVDDALCDYLECKCPYQSYQHLVLLSLAYNSLAQ